MDPYLLEPAHVQLDEYLGTVAAEHDITIHGDDLYEVVGLDRDKWTILGIEFYDGTGPQHGSVDVYAIDREAHDVHSYDRLREIADGDGALPVTHFAVHGVRPEQISQRVFKRYKVQLRSASTADVELRVEAQGDLRLD